MEICNLRVDGYKTPIGTGSAKPCFSFETNAIDGIFLASLYEEKHNCRVQEMVINRDDCRGFYFPKPLQEGMRYRLEISDGKSCALTRFETAEQFFFRFIKPECKTKTLPQLYFPFEVGAEICYARLLLSASCKVTVLLNREQVNAIPPCNEKCFYTVDLTHFLWRGGENELTVLFSEREVCVAAGILLFTESGKKRIYGIPSGCRIRESGIIFDESARNEEHRCITENAPIHSIFSCCAALPNKPRCLLAEHRRVMAPADIVEIEEGHLLVDFGRLLDGTARLRIRLSKGKQVVFCFLPANKANDASINRFTFYGTGKPCLYQPLFSRYSFRHLLVEGLSRHEAWEIEAIHFLPKEKADPM